jgi:phytoene dehydrogenase-like protein
VSDAVVIGAGPNGLVAANLLAERGWQVVVLEAQDEPGGAVRSAEMAPGVHYDLFSSFYPLGAASPAIAALDLERWGLRWRHSPLVVGHPFPDGRSAVISTDLKTTYESVEAFGDGQGERWVSLFEQWEKTRGGLLQSLLGAPFPPVRGPLNLACAIGLPGVLEMARFAMLPLRRMCDEENLLEGITMLLAGNALHSDLTPDLPLSGFFGWLLAMLAQDVGFPVPEGGAGELTAALVRRLESFGGTVICGAPVTSIEIRRGRARAAVTADGQAYAARRAILADVAAPLLYRNLLDEDELPPRLRSDLDRFQLDNATFKVDWLIDRPVPWEADGVRGAGTVHIADDLSELAHTGLQLAEQLIPEKAFVVLGQSSVADGMRTPDDTELVWAYTHVPQRIRGDAGGDLTGEWTQSECERMADRIEERIESRAPGFRATIRTRRIMGPPNLNARDANLLGGAINGGTSALHQQLIFRPTPGLGRPETPIGNLFLASAAAHPGGGVHGACGANAARAAIARHRVRRGFVALAGTGAAAALASRQVRRSA